MRRLFIVGILLAFVRPAYCGASSFGEIMAAEPSVRAAGMGNAYTGMTPGDVYGMHYNPASYVTDTTIGLGFERGYSEDSTMSLAFGMPKVWEGVSVGASLLYYNAGDITMFSSNGQEKTINGERDYLGTLNVSRAWGPYSAGVNVKMARTTLFEEKSASAFMGDFGALAAFEYFRLGVALQNIGGRMKLGDETETVPTTLRAGVSRLFEKDQLAGTLAFDWVKPQFESAYYRAGGELLYDNLLALRAGYESKNSLSQENQFKCGCGFKWNNFSLDYALVPYKTLGSTHHFALAIALGPAAKAEPKARRLQYKGRTYNY